MISSYVGQLFLDFLYWIQPINKCECRFHGGPPSNANTKNYMNANNVTSLSKVYRLSLGAFPEPSTINTIASGANTLLQRRISLANILLSHCTDLPSTCSGAKVTTVRPDFAQRTRNLRGVRAPRWFGVSNRRLAQGLSPKGPKRPRQLT